MANENKQYAKWIDLPDGKGGTERKWLKDDEAVKITEITNPSSGGVIDEYQRVLAALYQALTDAQQVVIPAREAAAMVDAAKGSYDTLEARITAIEQSAARFGFTASTDPMSLLY